MMRWVAVGLGVLLALGACAAPVASEATPTPDPHLLNALAPTTRPTATLTRAQQLAQVDPRPLAADPSKFNGQSVTLYGKAATVEQQDTGTWFQLVAEVPGRPGVTESIVVIVQPKRSDILRGECYLIEGTGAGTQQVARTLTGAQSQAPVVRARSVESLRACS